MASGLEISDARKKLNHGGIASLRDFGIDLESLMRQIGIESAKSTFSLRGISQEIEFLNEMMDWWEHAGWHPQLRSRTGVPHQGTIL